MSSHGLGNIRTVKEIMDVRYIKPPMLEEMKPIIRNHVRFIRTPRQRPERCDSLSHHDNSANNIQNRASNLYDRYGTLPPERYFLELHGNKSRNNGTDCAGSPQPKFYASREYRVP